MVKHQKFSKYNYYDYVYSQKMTMVVVTQKKYELILEQPQYTTKNPARFFWYGIYNDVEEYIQKCNRCQRQTTLPPNVKNEMQSVPVSPHVMKQVCLNLCCLPKVDGYHQLIICIDYFTKWSEDKPIRDKPALTVATFLYKLMCRHNCCEVQKMIKGKNLLMVCILLCTILLV